MNQRRKKVGASATCRWLALSSFLFVLVAGMTFAYVTVLNRINQSASHTPGTVVRVPDHLPKTSEKLFTPQPSTEVPHIATTVTQNEQPVVRPDEDREDRADEQYRLRNEQLRTTTAAQQLSVFDKVRHILANHPIHQIKQSETSSSPPAFEDYFVHVKSHSSCANLPLFVSMANVFSDLYWQMIENFIYTMVKFELSDCAVMVCVSDPKCMERCQESLFPCVDFQYKQYHPEARTLPHTLEQIAELKLFHIPKVLSRQVDIIMLDLDVGFLSDPRRLLEGTKPKFDVYVQKDIAYVMNRTREGWRTWYTVPLPNIGIMYVRANQKSVRMFADAWTEYKTIAKATVKENPGKDQNKVAGAMNRGGMYGFRWAFFPAGSAILLDMMYKFNDPRYELGGLAAYDLFTVTNNVVKTTKASSNTMKVTTAADAASISDREMRLAGRRGKRHQMSVRTQDVGLSSGDVYAVHTTCYEQGSKILGLKAANAYWNPFYYTANRRTLVKPLVFITEEQLRHEVRSLMYLAYATNRSVIIPNILANDAQLPDMDLYRDRALWPGFRVLHEKKLAPGEKNQRPPVTVLEPAYYWRIERDYFMGSAASLIPEPVVVPLFRRDPAFLQEHGLIPPYQGGAAKERPIRNDLTIVDVEKILLSPEFHDQPRLVLNVFDRFHLPPKRDERKPFLKRHNEHVHEWAKDSVGDYGAYAEELKAYGELPRLTDRDAYESAKYPVEARWIIDNTRLCMNMFDFDRGNRSCFDKCK